MKLLLERTWFLPERTIGRLYIDGTFETFTLEDALQVNGKKIPGKTAIPAGEYVITLTWSPKFGKHLPEITGVKNYSGIRLHAGVTEAMTRGCVLLGDTKSADGLGDAKPAAARVIAKLLAALHSNEHVTITVTNPPEAPK